MDLVSSNLKLKCIHPLFWQIRYQNILPPAPPPPSLPSLPLSKTEEFECRGPATLLLNFSFSVNLNAL